MNNHERAGRIWDDLSGRAGCGIDSWEPAIKTECLDMIAAQIDEAVEEYATQVKEPIRCAYNQGYAAAREQAAGIAESHPADDYGSDVCRAIARKICAMVPPGEGK